MICNMLCGLCGGILCESYYAILSYFNFRVQMDRYPLLSQAIDRNHRAAIWEKGREPHVLRTRTPAHNWKIHPAWVDRYVS